MNIIHIINIFYEQDINWPRLNSVHNAQSIKIYKNVFTLIWMMLIKLGHWVL